MAACHYRVMHIGIKKNVRGVEMRLMVLTAMPSDPFGPDAAAAQGQIEQLVTPEFAARFTIGDEVAVSFRALESD